MQDPIFPHIYIVNTETDQNFESNFKGAMLAIFSGNIWSKVKSPTIKILCCIGSSFINKINSSINKPTGPGAQ